MEDDNANPGMGFDGFDGVRQPGDEFFFLLCFGCLILFVNRFVDLLVLLVWMRILLSFLAVG